MNSNGLQSRSRAPRDGNVNGVLPSQNAILLPWILLVISWFLLVGAFFTKHNSLFDHDYLLKTSHLPWIIALGVFLLSWQVMTMAMMLPSSFSRLLILSESHESCWHAQAFFLMSYACVWSGFACLAFCMDTLIHQLVQHWWWLYLHSQLIGALLLSLAGVCQWSPLKRQCLHQCIELTNMKTEISFQEAMFSSWKQGWRYGIRCLGSSWTLMLIMFGIGMRSLFVIVLLTVVMFLEREVLQGEYIRRVIGVTLLIFAVLWYLFPLSIYV